MRDLVDELLRAKVETTLFGDDRAPRLGRLEILERIGAGAMGTVFRARDPRLEREVAVKVVAGGVLEEARALARLQHPNVVAVHDADEEDGLVYIVMELAPGESLRAYKPASWRDVVRVMREAGAGIAAAHAAGLVHRDIKPANILVGADRTRVVDFGLARPNDDGTRGGTVEYMAPEVLDGGPATRASDQYAFGLTLREKLPDDAPRWLLAIAERASAPDPHARFPSMTAVVAALGRDRRRAYLGLAAITVIACGAAAGVFFVRSPADPCASGDARADAVWPAAARSRVADILGAAPWTDQTLASLDEAKSHWKASFHTVCSAKGAQSDALFDLRMRCLDRALDRFGALATELGNAEPHSSVAATLGTARSRVSIAAPPSIVDLPAPAGCETLRDAGELALPTDPAARANVQLADRALANASAAFALGRYTAARSIIDSIALADPAGSASIDLRGIDAPRVRAEVLALSAAIEARTGNPAAAHGKLDDALVAAAAANAPALEADIWARRLRDELFAGNPAKVLEWSQFARAAAARARRRGAEIDGVIAEALRDEGKLGAARDLLREALASPDPLPPAKRAVLELNLASVEIAAGHSAVAAPMLEQARAEVRGSYGDQHPELALYDDKLAAVARARGHLVDAMALHARSLALRTAAFGDDDRAVATSLFHRAQTEIDANKLDNARADLDRAIAIRTKVFGDKSPRLGELYATLADLELAQKHVPAARDALAKAALDPRLDLTARRFAAGDKLASADIPPIGNGELISLDRAAALDVRAQLLDREKKPDELDELVHGIRAHLEPNLDVPVAVSLAHVLLVADDYSDALTTYRALVARLSSEPSRTADRVRRDLAGIDPVSTH